MNKAKTSPKEEAQRALARGDWKKALDFFQKHCAEAPGDLRSRMKIPELLERLGRRKDAIQEYKKVAEAYSEDGFLLKAISVHKMILRMDPSNQETGKLLKKLQQKRGEEESSFQPFSQLPLFSELHERERDLLFQRLQAKTYARESLILREGEKGDSLLIIGRGEVAVTKGDPKGKEIRICNLKAGDLLGEFGLLADQKRHATVKAMTECEILEISGDELNEISKGHPRIKEVLSRSFKKRVFDMFLALSPLFSSLTSKEREEMIGRFRLLKAPGEMVLFKGGDPPSSLFVIKSGMVEIFTQDRQGSRVHLATLKSGDFFGEIGLLLDKPRMAFAQAVEPSELLELTKEDLDRCLIQFPALRQNLKKIASERLSAIKEILSRKDEKKTREAPA